MWSCAGLVTGVPWNTHGDTTRARHGSTPLFPGKQSMEQQMGTGITWVHPVLCSTQPMQQGFE